MPVIVQKFGGTSVATAEKIRTAARRAVDAKRAGHDVVLVLSARGKTTDELIALADEITDTPDPREMDSLLATGEQESTALAAMAIRSLGEDAVSLTGGQLGMKTDDRHTRARIQSIDTARIRRELDAGRIVVACGFQGVSPAGDVTTLGRGGSDTTATALAAALDAEVCEIYTDVEGVFTTDPRKVPDARKVERIGYDEMLELASLGAGVMHSRSIEFAKKFRVPLRVRPSFADGEGTLIEALAASAAPVTGLAVVEDECRVTLSALPDEPGVMSSVFEEMARQAIPIDMVIQNIARGGIADVSFTVPKGVLAETLTAATAAVDRIGSGRITQGTNVAKVSAVGSGMRKFSGVAARMFRALADSGVNIEMVTTSEIKVSALVTRDGCLDALRRVHEEFDLQTPPPEPAEVEPHAESQTLQDVVSRMAGMEDIVVSDAALDVSQSRLSLSGVPDRVGTAADVLEAIAEAGVSVDMIVQNSGTDGLAAITVTCPRGDLRQCRDAVEKRIAEWPGCRVDDADEIAKLSVTGVGLRSHTGVGQALFRALSEAGVNVQMVATSETVMSAVVSPDVGEKALAAVTAAFGMA